MSQADLTFDPALGLVAPDTEAIRATVADDYVRAFRQDGKPDLDVDPTTPAGQLIDAETGRAGRKIGQSRLAGKGICLYEGIKLQGWRRNNFTKLQQDLDKPCSTKFALKYCSQLLLALFSWEGARG